MGLKKTFCINHPDRPAVGICVITKNPICEECSTRYDGVNYSREGLAIMRARRKAGAGRRFWRDHAWFAAMVILSPLWLLMLYAGVFAIMRWLMQRGSA